MAGIPNSGAQRASGAKRLTKASKDRGSGKFRTNFFINYTYRNRKKRLRRFPDPVRLGLEASHMTAGIGADPVGFG
jgi:hypothetical protein